MNFPQFCFFTHSSNFFAIVFNFENELAFCILNFMFINQLIVTARGAGNQRVLCWKYPAFVLLFPCYSQLAHLQSKMKVKLETDFAHQATLNFRVLLTTMLQT